MSTPVENTVKTTGVEPGNKTVTSLWRGKRFFIMALLFFASLINYIDRVSMSVAAPVISKEFGWDAGTMGIVLSAFLWSYAFCLVPVGWLTDKLRPRKINALAVAFWSVAAMLTGMANNFVTMVSSRLALGAGESATMPAGSKVVRQWFTIQERGLATALARSGAEAGPAIGMPLIAWLLTEAGWRVAFVITGAIGFVWLFFWLKYFRNNPQECAWVSADERKYIAENTDSEKIGEEKGVSITVILQLLKQKTTWGLALSHGCIMYTQYLILTWLPSYLMQVRHMELMKASLFSAFAFVTAWVLGIAVCKLSDTLLTPEKVLQGRRRIMVITFMALSSIFIFTTMVDSPIVIFIIITLVKTFLASTIGLNMTLTNDLVANPAVAGSAFGILLLGGNLFGSMAPVVTGYIVKTTGSFDSAFLLAGVLIIIGALISATMTRKPINIE
ncbi:MFS transporter [Sporomusa acidovorans]|uniref:Glucarate transporter n=1 Tax=Sporomusa acidovorans (strain ATCC 49682 / DSM 3132 / Mol) TaxID=1123286 RepID=A0ABZ3J268_SPOA4|nr:MFS transporter [Sporomusa acidovorans]OZC24142.1 putative glucarate transporter [Sporomusa acidovorans DSM 3132]SDF36948.1 MFS transporter, ACS family, glucarate transporter [Sporomusa acidovorans]